VLDELGADRLYAQNGLQFLVFNTMFQLAAAMGTPQLAAAERLLLIPDLLGYWLTGNQGAERTNASTTGLLDARTKAWSVQLCAELGVSADILPPLREPGDKVGDLTDEVLEAVGLTGSVPVWAVGSHDTASAVVGVPASSEHFAYISCGTWSLVGLELDAPILTPQSRAANFTNEVGVDGTVRYLRNVMGLWLLQECVRTWELRDGPLELAALLDAAGRAPAFRAVIDPDDAAFLPPGDMPARITAACVRTGQRPPADAAATVRCILDSLALAYRRTLQDGQRLSGRRVDVVHLVGGGANNTLLCQLTADACGLPVEAGPVESAALGNVLVQARSLGRVGGDLASMRRLLRSTQTVRRYEPTGGASGWAEAAARVAAPMTG
jgi:rhamnulokinase